VHIATHLHYITNTAIRTTLSKIRNVLPETVSDVELIDPGIADDTDDSGWKRICSSCIALNNQHQTFLKVKSTTHVDARLSSKCHLKCYSGCSSLTSDHITVYVFQNYHLTAICD